MKLKYILPFLITLIALASGCASQHDPTNNNNQEEHTSSTKQATVGQFTKNIAWLDPKYIEDSQEGDDLRSAIYSTLDFLYAQKIRIIVVNVGLIKPNGYLGTYSTSGDNELSPRILDFLSMVGAWEAINTKAMTTYAMLQVDLRCDRAGQTYANCTGDPTFAPVGNPNWQTTAAANINTCFFGNGALYPGPGYKHFQGVMLDMEPGGTPISTSGSSVDPNNVANQIRFLSVLRAATPIGGIAIATPRYWCDAVNTSSYQNGVIYSQTGCSDGLSKWKPDAFYNAGQYAGMVVPMVYDQAASASNYTSIAKATAYFGALSLSGEYWQGSKPLNNTGAKFLIGLPAYQQASASHDPSIENMQLAGPAAMAGLDLLPWTLNGCNMWGCNWTRYTTPYVYGAALYKHRSGYTCSSGAFPCDPTGSIFAIKDMASCGTDAPCNPDWAWWSQYWAGP